MPGKENRVTTTSERRRVLPKLCRDDRCVQFEDFDRSVVETTGEGLPVRCVGDHRWCFPFGGELRDLLARPEAPDSNGTIGSHADHLLTRVVIVHVHDRLGVGAHENAVLAVDQIQDAQRTRHGRNQDACLIVRGDQTTDRLFVLGFDVDLSEIDRPHANVTVIRAGDAERVRAGKGTDANRGSRSHGDLVDGTLRPVAGQQTMDLDHASFVVENFEDVTTFRGHVDDQFVQFAGR